MDRIEDQLRQIIRGDGMHPPPADLQNPLYDVFKQVVFKMDLLRAAQEMLQQTLHEKKEAAKFEKPLGEPAEKHSTPKMGYAPEAGLPEEVPTDMTADAEAALGALSQEGEEIPNYWQQSVQQANLGAPLQMPGTASKAKGTEAGEEEHLAPSGTTGFKEVPKTGTGELPPWQRNPADWTIWLVDWMITGRVLPQAYAELMSLAYLGHLNQEEMMLLAKIRHDMTEVANNKSKMTYDGKTINTAMLKKYPSLIKILWKIIAPFWDMQKYIKELEAMGKGHPSVSGYFESLFKAFNDKFGTGSGAFKGPAIYRLDKQLYILYEDYKNHVTGANWTNAVNYANSQLTGKMKTWFNNFNWHVNMNASSPNFSEAWNNFGPGGPWGSMKIATGNIGVVLSDIGLGLQTDVQLAMMGLQSKLNAASAIIEQVAKMLGSIAQNVRTSA